MTLAVLDLHFTGVFVATDFILAVMPYFFIRRLRLPVNQKIGLSILMGLGLMASAAAVPKIVNIARYREVVDLPWQTMDLVMWIELEVYIGIIAASLPALKSTFDQFLRRLGFFQSSDEDDLRKPRVDLRSFQQDV